MRENAATYPLTIYSNGIGAKSRQYSGGNLHQGRNPFLNQNEVSHVKFKAHVYPRPRSAKQTFVRTKVGPAYADKFGYGRGLIDMRRLNCAIADRRKSGGYYHFVILPYRGGMAYYEASYSKNYGIIHPTWTVYWVKQEGDKFAWYACTPPGQGYNQSTTRYTEPMRFPNFSEDNLKVIEEAYTEFLGYKCTNSFYEESVAELSHYEPDFTPNWRVDDSKTYIGELSAKAIQGVEFFSGNGQALIHDVANLNDSFTSTLNDIKGMSKGRLKAFASAYLSVHYGYKLLASDIKELSDELIRYSGMNNTTSVTAGESYIEDGITYTDRVEIFYEMFGNLPSDLSKLSYLLDITPSFHTIWDSIPFSFLVDWCTNIGELCSGIDDFYTIAQRHRVIGTTSSHKKERQFTTTIGNETFDVMQTSYVRNCASDWMPIPTFQFNAGVPSIGHAGEVTALMVVNTKN